MMKRLVTIALTLLCLGASAQRFDNHYLSEQEAPAEGFRGESKPVQWNREQPRTETISYSSETEAMSGSMEASRYFAPLNEGWSQEQTAGGVKFKNSFGVPFVWADRLVILRIGETNGAYDLYINGKRAGYNQNGASAAEFDVSRFVSEGVNKVEIELYSEYLAEMIERESSETPKLIGDIYVVSQPKVRIRDFVYDLNFEEGNANLGLGVIVKSHLLNPKEYRVFYELIAPDGTVAAHSYRDARFEMMQEDTVRFFANIPNAFKWSHESPHLYTLLLKTQHEGRFGEYIAYKVGLRTVGQTDGEVVINDTPTKLYIAELGDNYSKEALATKLDELLASNFNAVRFPKPVPRYYYDLCDQKGVYAISQTNICTQSSGESRARYGNPSNDPQWEDSYVDRTKSAYYTTQNHPSVVGFSLADHSANGYNLYVSYLTLKSIESERPILYMSAEGEWNSDFVTAEISQRHPMAVSDRVVQSIGRGNPAPDNNEPIIIRINDETATYRIENHSHISHLSGKVTFLLKQGWKIVSKGEMEFNVPPSSAREISLPLGEAKPGREIKYHEVEFEHFFK